MKLYVSSNKYSDDLLHSIKDCVEIVDSISRCDKVLVFLNDDTHLAKQDINYALDKGKPVICIKQESYIQDAGLEMQLGLEKVFSFDDDENEIVEAVLTKTIKKRSFVPMLISAVVLIICIVAVIIFQNKTNTIKDDKNNDSIHAIDTVSMDSKLEQALIDLGYDSNGDGHFTKDELLLITDVDLSNKEIRDISAVIYMENLKKLNLSNNNISNAQALISLTKLEDLDISGNRELDDISFIKFMTSLKNITYDE